MMGVDICYFIDHDLPTDNSDAFLAEFKKRVRGNAVVLDDVNEQERSKFFGKNIWKICCNGIFERDFTKLDDVNTDIFYKDEHLYIELNLYKRVLEVFEMQIEGRDIPDWCRWNTLCGCFERNDPYNAKGWIKNLKENYRKYLAPVFHSDKVLLVADSSSYRHETLYGEYLMGGGMSIEETLEKNKQFSPPCKVLRNDEVIGRNRSDYYDEGEESIGALFLFDL